MKESRNQYYFGFAVSIIGVIGLILSIYFSDNNGLSNVEILLLAFFLISSMGGISISVNSRNYKKRKRYIKIAFPSVISIIVAGISLKSGHIMGAGPMIIFGNFFLCFALIPVIAKNRFERWQNFTKSKLQIIGLMMADSLGIAFLVISLTIYVQHWPGFILFISIGVVLIVLSIILWNFKFEQLFALQTASKRELEQQHTEILDSITYAKRIQSAILPPPKLIKEYLPESFILYKPKDVVAGDFYWLEHKGDQVLFAAADCTGHGVPGAMVSVICNNGLNRSVREYGLTDPGQILDKTRDVVIQEFEKSEEEVKDGMDIALCSLEGNTLKYAGANNPLWIIRDGEIIETKANKQPIGKYTDPKPFTTHSIELKKGDSIYIFSDGYVDQFGGEKGKKFKPANLRKLLLSIQDQSMEKKKELLDEAFESWRGDLEQIDDVCLIGVKV
jgi:serine phosphatase RsbU (regulator of sigma subunit)